MSGEIFARIEALSREVDTAVRSSDLKKVLKFLEIIRSSIGAALSRELNPQRRIQLSTLSELYRGQYNQLNRHLKYGGKIPDFLEEIRSKPAPPESPKLQVPKPTVIPKPRLTTSLEPFTVDAPSPSSPLSVSMQSTQRSPVAVSSPKSSPQHQHSREPPPRLTYTPEPALRAEAMLPTKGRRLNRPFGVSPEMIAAAASAPIFVVPELFKHKHGPERSYDASPEPEIQERVPTRQEPEYTYIETSAYDAAVETEEYNRKMSTASSITVRPHIGAQSYPQTVHFDTAYSQDLGEEYSMGEDIKPQKTESGLKINLGSFKDAPASLENSGQYIKPISELPERTTLITPPPLYGLPKPISSRPFPESPNRPDQPSSALPTLFVPPEPLQKQDPLQGDPELKAIFAKPLLDFREDTFAYVAKLSGHAKDAFSRGNLDKAYFIYDRIHRVLIASIGKEQDEIRKDRMYDLDSEYRQKMLQIDRKRRDEKLLNLVPESDSEEEVREEEMAESLPKQVVSFAPPAQVQETFSFNPTFEDLPAVLPVARTPVKLDYLPNEPPQKESPQKIKKERKKKLQQDQHMDEMAQDPYTQDIDPNMENPPHEDMETQIICPNCNFPVTPEFTNTCFISCCGTEQMMCPSCGGELTEDMEAVSMPVNPDLPTVVGESGDQYADQREERKDMGMSKSDNLDYVNQEPISLKKPTKKNKKKKDKETFEQEPQFSDKQYAHPQDDGQYDDQDNQLAQDPDAIEIICPNCQTLVTLEEQESCGCMPSWLSWCCVPCSSVSHQCPNCQTVLEPDALDGSENDQQQYGQQDDQQYDPRYADNQQQNAY